MTERNYGQRRAHLTPSTEGTDFRICRSMHRERIKTHHRSDLNTNLPGCSKSTGRLPSRSLRNVEWDDKRGGALKGGSGLALKDHAATSAYSPYVGYHHNASNFSPSPPPITVHPECLSSFHRRVRLSCQPSVAVCIVIARTLWSSVQSTCVSIRIYDEKTMDLQ